MSKVTIFLDIDGVMVPCPHNKRWPDHEDGQELFCEKATQRLLEICEKFNCELVISSAWRGGHTPQSFQELLQRRDINIPVVGLIGGGHGGVRGWQILEYIEKYDVKQFIILEDEPCDLLQFRKFTRRIPMKEGLGAVPLDEFAPIRLVDGEVEWVNPEQKVNMSKYYKLIADAAEFQMIMQEVMPILLKENGEPKYDRTPWLKFSDHIEKILNKIN